MKLKRKLAIGFIRAKFKLLTVISKRKAAEKAFELFCTPLSKSEIRTPAIFKQAEQLQFTLNTLKINGFRWNHPKQHKVLILHGFGSAAHKFHQYIGPLLKKDYEVLAFDCQAHGSSEGRLVNAEDYRELIELVIKQYGPINSFLAHSFGGIGLSLALENVAHTADTRIALIAPATETSSAVTDAFIFLGIKDPEVRKEFDNIIFEKSGRQTAWFSINRAMQHISGQVLWVHDEEDDVTPWRDALKVKEQQLPNIRFIVTKGLGHRKIYGDQAVQNEVLSFL